jgi:hypothetical protein
LVIISLNLGRQLHRIRGIGRDRRRRRTRKALAAKVFRGLSGKGMGRNLRAFD